MILDLANVLRLLWYIQSGTSGALAMTPAIGLEDEAASQCQNCRWNPLEDWILMMDSAAWMSTELRY